MENVGHTLLHEAIVHNKFEIFKLTLLYNANVNAQVLFYKLRMPQIHLL